MSGYNQQSWNQRFAKGGMGDEAEGVYEAVSPQGSWVRFGWNRNALMRQMSNTLKHTPDYYADKAGYLVEVMGCSGPIVRSMKLTKWDAMKRWNQIQPVAFFVWNTKRRAWVLVEYEQMKRLVARSRREGRVKAFENDGNEYFEMEWDWLYEHASATGGYIRE